MISRLCYSSCILLYFPCFSMLNFIVKYIVSLPQWEFILKWKLSTCKSTNVLLFKQGHVEICNSNFALDNITIMLLETIYLRPM